MNKSRNTKNRWVYVTEVKIRSSTAHLHHPTVILFHMWGASKVGVQLHMSNPINPLFSSGWVIIAGNLNNDQHKWVLKHLKIKKNTETVRRKTEGTEEISSLVIPCQV